VRCPHCGFDDEGNFCSKCGNPLSEEVSLPVKSQSVDKTSDWHVSLSFGKSTSQNFSKALAIAKASPQYIESVDDKGNPIYQAIYGSGEYLKFITLYELIGKWKSAFVFVNGEIVDRKIVGDINYCYGDKLRSGKSDFCFGASQFTENPFGCHRAQMHSYNDPWYSFGIIDTKGRFHIDKDRIRQELIQRLEPFRFCPALNMERAMNNLDKLPDVIDPNIDDNWEYTTFCNKETGASFKGVQPRGRGLVGSVTYEIKIDLGEVAAGKERDGREKQLLPNPKTNEKSRGRGYGCLVLIVFVIIIIAIGAI